jgi:uncharacterized protein YjbJ (UPF0337 family)
MSTEDRAKAVGKNIEGKLQEVWGNLTGSKKDETAGKAKQAESAARHALEDVKETAKGIADQAKKAIDKL